ncbi:MAG: hypothetical protein KKF80_04165, partial [Candidatus Omnitrophica bacterium]|nr:hypothetical protein [Candidatus Omnitrophota bacterium]
MKRFIVKSFQMRVTLALVAALFLVAALSNFLIYRFMAQFQLESLRDKLKIIAQTASLALDAETLMSVPLRKEGIETPQYRVIADKLSQIKKANPPIRFIYTMTKTEQEGIWQFVVDPEPAADGARGKNATAYPGDRYDARRFHELLRAFDGPSADKKLEVDEWGVTLSGYA